MRCKYCMQTNVVNSVQLSDDYYSIAGAKNYNRYLNINNLKMC